MKFFEQKIKGVFIIEAEPVIDDRGIFRRQFCAKEFADHGIADNICQANISENHYSLTLRGFHYQDHPFAEAKTLSCLRGIIYDVIVDLREESTTYMEWVSVELSSVNRKCIHIPIGCANAFLTLERDCMINYYISQSYEPSAEKGIRYNDPSFNFEFPAEPKVISDRDLNHPDFIKK